MIITWSKYKYNTKTKDLEIFSLNNINFPNLGTAWTERLSKKAELLENCDSKCSKKWRTIFKIFLKFFDFLIMIRSFRWYQLFQCISTGSYCAILNPALPPLPPQFELRLRFGETEYRFEQDPFVLYPGEILEGAKGTDFTAGMSIKG